MITGLSSAYRALHDDSLYDCGVRAANYLRSHLFDAGSASLVRSYRDGGAASPTASADDYAFLIRGLLDLYQCKLDGQWLEWAVQLQRRQDDLFWDPELAGYFSSAAGGEDLLLRLKDDHDGAEPASTSVAVENLLRLACLFPDQPRYQERVDQTLTLFYNRLMEYPHSMTHLTADLLLRSVGMRQVGVIVIVIVIVICHCHRHRYRH